MTRRFRVSEECKLLVLLLALGAAAALLATIPWLLHAAPP